MTGTGVGNGVDVGGGVEVGVGPAVGMAVMVGAGATTGAAWQAVRVRMIHNQMIFVVFFMETLYWMKMGMSMDAVNMKLRAISPLPMPNDLIP
jgi:hypothetical protein